MALIYLADLAVATSAGVATTLRFTSGKTQTIGGFSYKSNVAQPAYYSQSLSIDTAIGGAISSSVGELILTNTRRDLDVYKDYIFEGKLLTLSTYDTVSTVTTAILVQKIEQAIFEWDKVSIRLQNGVASLDKPLQTAKYAGSNILPAGVDGVSDLKDKYKPLVFGRVNNMTPILVNSSKLIYQISSGTIEKVVSVMSNGGYLTAMATMPTTFAAFTATDNPADAGYYVFYSGTEGSFIRIGMNYGTITCSVWEKLSALSNSPAQIIKRIITLAGVTSFDYLDSDFTAIDRIIADNVGIVVGEGQTTASVLTDICSSIGLWYGYDSTNLFRLYYFGFTTPIQTIQSVSSDSVYGITSFDLTNATINGKPVPVKGVKANYDKNWTVQDKASLAGNIVVNNPGRVNWLSKEYRTAESTTTSNYPDAQVFEYNTLLVGAYAARAEADRVRNLFSPKRVVVDTVVRLSLSNLNALYIGATVTITLPRYGMDTGKDFIILSMELDYFNKTAKLTLWG